MWQRKTFLMLKAIAYNENITITFNTAATFNKYKLQEMYGDR